MSKVFHLHIPKTAGSFINNYLRKNFGSTFLHENPYLSTVNYSKEEVDEMLHFYNFNCYAGHVFNLNNVDLGDSNFGFSFVRNPIDKFLSFYFFQRGRNEIRNDHPIKRLNLEDYIDYLKNQLTNTIATDGSQLDWVAGSVQKDCSLINSKINSGNYVVFPQDRMNESLFCLISMKPDVFKIQPILKVVNSSTRDQEISKKTLKAIASLPWIKKDQEFYSLASEHLDTCFQGREDEFNSWVESCTAVIQKKPKSFKAKVKSKLMSMLNG